MKTILIIYDYFDPAYKAGGILRSLVNLVRNFNAQWQFKIITSDKDLGDTTPLPGISANQWQDYGPNTSVIYLSSAQTGYRRFKAMLASVTADVWYIQGVYSLRFVLFPLLIARTLSKKPLVIIAPRGMLQKGALSVKPLKKKVYLQTFRLLQLHKGVRWHATDAQETRDICSVFGPDADVVFATDTPDLKPGHWQPIRKEPNSLRLVMISLITEKKNILATLRALKTLQNEVNVTYDIYGPVKDATYWQACEQEINSLGPTIQVNYHGDILPAQVPDILQQYHFFILPSLGENFGHAIYESLKVGRPVIISDKTPWRDLQLSQAGWDVDLSNPTALPNAIRQAFAMDQSVYDCYCEGARQVAATFVEKSDFLRQYQQLFAVENRL